MRIRLTRTAELLLPGAMLLCALLGRAEQALMCLAACMLGRLCTLCGAEGVRRAAGEVVSPARLRGAWTGAASFAVVAGIAAYLWGDAAWTWLFSAPPDAQLWAAGCAVGLCEALARLSEEHMYCAGQCGSAALSAFVRSALLAGGVLSGAVWAAGAAALGLIASLAVALGAAGSPLARPNAAALRRMPMAALRALLFPVPGLLAAAGFARTSATWAAAGYLIALGAYQCAAAPLRRSREESHGARAMLVVPAALACAAAPFLGEGMRAVATLTTFAAALGIAVYVAPTARGAGMALCLAAACVLLRLDYGPFIAPALAACALALLTPDVHEAILRARARRNLRARRKRAV